MAYVLAGTWTSREALRLPASGDNEDIKTTRMASGSEAMAPFSKCQLHILDHTPQASRWQRPTLSEIQFPIKLGEESYLI